MHSLELMHSPSLHELHKCSKDLDRQTMSVQTMPKQEARLLHLVDRKEMQCLPVPGQQVFSEWARFPTDRLVASDLGSTFVARCPLLTTLAMR